METQTDTDVPRKRFSEEDRFGLLVQKGGGLTVVDYLKLPNDTKAKVHKLFKVLRQLPDRFLTSEVQDMIVKDLGIGDYQRILKMLAQGGYLQREKDFRNRVVHIKTDLAKTLSDNELAADILAKNPVMLGFPVSTRPRKKNMKPHAAPELRPQGSSIMEDPVELEASGCNTEVTLPAETAPNDLRKAMTAQLKEELAKLDEGDTKMILQFIESFKVIRTVFPRLSRKAALETYIAGGRYAEG